MTNYRKIRTVWQLSCLLLAAFTFHFLKQGVAHLQQQLAPALDHHTQSKPLEDNSSTSRPGILSKTTINQYVKAVLDSADAKPPKLACPGYNHTRYEYLKPTRHPGSQIKYLFALNLRECLPLLPRLLGSVIEAIRFLGPEHCSLSIVEGNSPDGTAEVLAGLQPDMDKLLGGRTHFVLSSTINPLEGDGSRFSKLADLRNMALQPLLDDPNRYVDATVVFINDVAICLEDILELVHQRHFLGSDMTCAMDWIQGGSEAPIFYDSYISRTIAGDLFFNIPPDTASYSFAHDLFWNEPVAQERFQAHQPFQVFSCWNGAVAFTATAVVEGKVSFRAVSEDKGECFQAEPQLFCKDMWFQGYGKIAVVPSVNLAYTNEDGERIKNMKGYTSQWVNGSVALEEKIEWRPPPERVKCMPTFTDQTWRLWNESLV